ncbi:MAG: hypothetical protein ACHQVK_00045 [Candidatus Paceibacterales bacterium]
MIKKIILFSIPLLIIGHVAFAAASFTAAPTTLQSGSEGSSMFTFASQSAGFMRFYLFDVSGNNISGNSNGNHADGTSPISWTAAGFPINLAVGTDTAIGVDNDGIAGGNTDAHCGSISTLMTCEAAINGAYWQIQTFSIIASSTVEGTSTIGGIFGGLMLTATLNDAPLAFVVLLIPFALLGLTFKFG